MQSDGQNGKAIRHNDGEDFSQLFTQLAAAATMNSNPMGGSELLNYAINQQTGNLFDGVHTFEISYSHTTQSSDK